MRNCEAPYHVDNCNGIGRTKDHITPKAVLKGLGFKSPKYWNRDENIQYLSQPCHSEKDRPSEWESELAKAGDTSKQFGQHHNEYLIYWYGMPEVEEAA